MKILSLVVAVLLCVTTLLGYLYTNYRFSALNTEFASTTRALGELQASFATYRTENDTAHTALSDRLYESAKTISVLTGNVEGFDSKVGQLSGSVETLEKLTTTDPELLQKYSKIYFLNENYKPADLAIIEEKYDLVNGKEVSIHADVLPFLKDMLHEATDDGVDLMVLSGYRSFTEQATLKGGYSVRYGNGANQFSADQGYSEHQLGTTVDFTTTALKENLGAFVGSDAYRWLNEHAYKYGFILSYPEGNSFYVNEPWHWRFVGKDLASYLHKKGVHFYDLEQREIDSYVATLFDE